MIRPKKLRLIAVTVVTLCSSSIGFAAISNAPAMLPANNQTTATNNSTSSIHNAINTINSTYTKVSNKMTRALSEANAGLKSQYGLSTDAITSLQEKMGAYQISAVNLAKAKSDFANTLSPSQIKAQKNIAIDKYNIAKSDITQAITHYASQNKTIKKSAQGGLKSIFALQLNKYFYINQTQKLLANHAKSSSLTKVNTLRKAAHIIKTQLGNVGDYYSLGTDINTALNNKDVASYTTLLSQKSQKTNQPQNNLYNNNKTIPQLPQYPNMNSTIFGE